MDAFLFQRVRYALKARLLRSNNHHVDSPAPGGSDNRLGIRCSASAKLAIIFSANPVNPRVSIFSDPENIRFVIAETYLPGKRMFSSTSAHTHYSHSAVPPVSKHLMQ